MKYSPGEVNSILLIIDFNAGVNFQDEVSNSLKIQINGKEVSYIILLQKEKILMVQVSVNVSSGNITAIIKNNKMKDDFHRLIPQQTLNTKFSGVYICSES